jgi:16S rRNA G966 N2-methylase RsmD
MELKGGAFGADSKRRDKYGEVFTPPILINELLDHLPTTIWSNPDLRWLDPCAGQGNFLVEILPRLMNGLSTKITDESKRRRHILTKMITMVELNPRNIRAIHETWPSAKVMKGDFLDEDVVPSILGAYDVIVANPPYQVAKTESYKGAAGNRTLWDEFLKKAMLIGHHIGFITPNNWRRPEHPMYQEITPKLTFLHIYSKPDGSRFFGKDVQLRFDLYVLNTKKTDPRIPLLVDENGLKYQDQIDVTEWPFLPNGRFRQIQQLLVRRNEEPQPVIFHSTLYDARKLISSKGLRYKYPIVHTITKMGMGLRWAKDRDPSQFGVAKVILNANEKQYPILDDRGKYGMSQLSFGIPIGSKTEGERVVKFLNSPGGQHVIESTKWGSFQTDYRMFKHFRRGFYDSATAVSVGEETGSAGSSIKLPKSGNLKKWEKEPAPEEGTDEATGSTVLGSSLDSGEETTERSPPRKNFPKDRMSTSLPRIHRTKKYRMTKKMAHTRKKK